MEWPPRLWKIAVRRLLDLEPPGKGRKEPVLSPNHKISPAPSSCSIRDCASMLASGEIVRQTPPTRKHVWHTFLGGRHRAIPGFKARMVADCSKTDIAPPETWPCKEVQATGRVPHTEGAGEEVFGIRLLRGRATGRSSKPDRCSTSAPAPRGPSSQGNWPVVGPRQPQSPCHSW